jgi:hypothetical protein
VEDGGAQPSQELPGTVVKGGHRSPPKRGKTGSALASCFAVWWDGDEARGSSVRQCGGNQRQSCRNAREARRAKGCMASGGVIGSSFATLQVRGLVVFLFRAHTPISGARFFPPSLRATQDLRALGPGICSGAPLYVVACFACSCTSQWWIITPECPWLLRLEQDSIPLPRPLLSLLALLPTPAYTCSPSSAAPVIISHASPHYTTTLYHMMLAISQSMPPSYPPSPAPPPDMTTSLPIIPRGPVAQRPKLSVNTAQPRSFGKGASLRLDTLSAVSPTRVNTFSNAYPALERPSKPRLSINSSVPNATSAPTSTTTTPSSASTLSSALTSASQESASTSIPYKQPHNLVSILANSPARSIIPRKMATSRPMFPAEKRVSFRTPLEEEITTVKYTLAHSDLDSSVSTLSSLASSTSSSDSSSSATHHSLTSTSAEKGSTSPSSTGSTISLSSSPRPKQPRTGDKRDSSSSEDDSDSCPETPIAGRRKRTRDWRWTLGPISGSDKSTTSEDSS